MDFLADENIHADIVAWLREENHDVLYAAEDLQSRSDDDLLDIAPKEQRILITDDKDFIEAVDVISIIQAKARQYLANNPA